VEYEGAIHHVMNLGDRREPIFLEDSDRLLFLETMGEACAKTDWQLHVGLPQKVNLKDGVTNTKNRHLSDTFHGSSCDDCSRALSRHT